MGSASLHAPYPARCWHWIEKKLGREEGTKQSCSCGLCQNRLRCMRDANPRTPLLKSDVPRLRGPGIGIFKIFYFLFF